jgi:hypothetical protein
VVAPSPWLVQLWLIDADCAFYDPTSPTEYDQPISVHVPPYDTEPSIATLQQFSPPATTLLTNLTEGRPLIRTELTVKTHDGGHQISGLVDCVATLDFVSEDFVRRFALQTRKYVTKILVRLANGQRVTSSTVCDVTFELARHEFHRTFYGLRDLRDADLILGLPWLDDEHASLQFGSTRVFTLMDGTAVETTLEERRPECLVMSSTKVQILMRKTRRSRGRHAEFYVIELTPAADQPNDFHTREELTTEQRDNFRSLLYDDFPELFQHVNSPHVSRLWDHPIETTGPMRRQRLNRLSHAERTELNRQFKDAVEDGRIRPSYSEFGSPIHFVRKADGSLRLCIDYRGLNGVTRKDAYPLPRVDDTLDKLKDANFYTHLDLASSFLQVRVRDKDIHKTAF